MFTEEQLTGMGREALIATATEQGIHIFPNWKDKTIAAKIIEKMSLQAAPENKEPKVTKAKSKPAADTIEGKQEMADFFNGLMAQGAEVTKDGDVVSVTFRGRKTCINVNQPMIAIRRAIEVFMVG